MNDLCIELSIAYNLPGEYNEADTENKRTPTVRLGQCGYIVKKASGGFVNAVRG